MRTIKTINGNKLKITRKMLEEKINEPENGTSRNESLETRVVIGIRGNKEITGLDGDGNGQDEVILYGKGGNMTEEQRGTFKDGELNGQGEKIVYRENGNKHIEKRGNFENDKLNGQGEDIIYYDNGNVKQEFTGIFKDDWLNGKGENHFLS